MILTIGMKWERQVEDMATASAVYSALRDQEERAGRGGCSQFPEGRLFENNKIIARISYNGKVWENKKWESGDKPLYNPY